MSLGYWFLDWCLPAVVFMLGTATALIINYPGSASQRERVDAHARAALSMAAILLAAGAFTGVMSGTGALKALAQSVVAHVPAGAGSHLPLVLALIAMPLSLLFDPDSFYFGVLPVVAETYRQLGGEPLQVAQAALVGQMTAGFPISPLTPANLPGVGARGGWSCRRIRSLLFRSCTRPRWSWRWPVWCLECFLHDGSCMSTEVVRIGCGAGFSGDRIEPAVELAQRGALDYLVFECLAERTIALAQKSKLQNAGLGYDPLLVERMTAVLPACVANGVRIISNMGAANPVAACQRTAEVARSLGLSGADHRRGGRGRCDRAAAELEYGPW